MISSYATGTEPRPWRRLYDNAVLPYFALFMNFWNILLLEFWKRRNHYLAFRWGVYDFEKEEKIRIGFKPTTNTTNLQTGKNEPHFPQKSRIPRQLASGIFVLIMLGLVIGSILVQIGCDIYLQTNRAFRGASVVLSIIGLAFVILLRAIYDPITKALNIWENYKTETDHFDAKILKIWSFAFCNVFSRV